MRDHSETPRPTPLAKRRTPVWILTGWLGSGKTSLLKHWLGDSRLADAALIINELGEVGLDDKLVAGASDAGSALIADACICCTGLPGLEEALADLFWDRLHRKRPHFGSVIVETTGLADPAPVVELFEQVTLIRERYEIAGVLTCVSASAGADIWKTHPEAENQIVHADLLVLTKTDLAGGAAPVAALIEGLHALNPRAPIGTSSRADLSWPEVGKLLATTSPTPQTAPQGCGHSAAHDHDHDHDHVHGHARAVFVPMAQAENLAELSARIQAALDSGPLLRMKGIVRTADGAPFEVQWSAGDTRATLAELPANFVCPPLGLTCIYSA